jgi:hypothetical protein
MSTLVTVGDIDHQDGCPPLRALSAAKTLASGAAGDRYRDLIDEGRALLEPIHTMPRKGHSNEAIVAALRQV